MFRCSMFWAFSLSEELWLENEGLLEEVSMLNVLSFFFMSRNRSYWSFEYCFDAQRFELFLYLFIRFAQMANVKTFRCSMFWAFSLFVWCEILEAEKHLGFDAQCSELFLYSYLHIMEEKILQECFDAQRFELFLYDLLQKYGWTCKRFDAQRSELFLYNAVRHYHQESGSIRISMLNVLSFFFMSKRSQRMHCLGYWFRCSMFWAFSL